MLNRTWRRWLTAGTLSALACAPVSCGGTDGGTFSGDAGDESTPATDGSGGMDGTVDLDGGNGDTASDVAAMDSAAMDSASDSTTSDASADANDAGPCTAVTSGIYYVDPLNGLDTGTGNVGCPVHTITHALALIGTAIIPASVYVEPTGTVATGETFPILVPQNVIIRTDPAATGKALVAIASAMVPAFRMASPLSTLSYLIIDGQTNTGLSGIEVLTGSTATTSINHLTIRNMAGPGIRVRDSGLLAGGVLSIGAGVVVTANGTVLARSSGLVINGGGAVSISNPAGATAIDPTQFDGNTEHGILLNGSGKLTVLGTAAMGTVTTNGNHFAGLFIAQNPALADGGGTPPPTCMIDGLVSSNTVAGNGVHLEGGSQVQIRNSIFLGNAGSGVVIVSHPAGSTSPINDDVHGIDLGVAALSAVAGKNEFQALADAGAGRNAGAGICLSVTPGVGAQLQAAGNFFSGQDCTQLTPGSISRDKTGCIGSVDVGIAGPASNSNTIITLNCPQL
jgi:hypothetical protein